MEDVEVAFMIQRSSGSVRNEYIAKIVLIAIFLGGFALFTGWMLMNGSGFDLFQLSAMELTLLAFSTYRMGRLIAYDRVMEPFRQFFTETAPDTTSAGESVNPKVRVFSRPLVSSFAARSAREPGLRRCLLPFCTCSRGQRAFS